MIKAIQHEDFPLFNSIEVKEYLQEADSYRVDFLSLNEANEEIDGEKGFVIKADNPYFTLTVEEKEELIKMYYGDETTLLVE